MAREGLRTLVVGKKKLSEGAYGVFERRYKEARTRTEGRVEAMAAVVEELERDLELLALTGVEDKLQEDVRPTLELLRNAGIRIWMLTGDKIETATCIAISTKLVARGQYIHQVAKRSSPPTLSLSLSLLVTRADKGFFWVRSKNGRRRAPPPRFPPAQTRLLSRHRRRVPPTLSRPVQNRVYRARDSAVVRGGLSVLAYSKGGRGEVD